MELKGSNGPAISCIVFMVDSLARDNDAKVTIETLHQDDCRIFEHMKENDITNDTIGEHKPTSDDALQHLYSCDCNAGIETVFTNPGGESLLVTFLLSEVKERHPWLNDEEKATEMLDAAKESGDESPLMQTLKVAFKKRVGTRIDPSLDWAAIERAHDMADLDPTDKRFN